MPVDSKQIKYYTRLEKLQVYLLFFEGRKGFTLLKWPCNKSYSTFLYSINQSINAYFETMSTTSTTPIMYPYYPLHYTNLEKLQVYALFSVGRKGFT